MQKNLLLALFSTIVMILIAEAVLRFARKRFVEYADQQVRISPAFGEKIHDHFFYDESGLFLIRPGSSGMHVGFNRPAVKITVNQAGFRGQELKPESKKIFITGDSIIFDGGNLEENTIAAHLERSLDQKYQVVNAGTTDVGVDQYLIQAKTGHLARYKPDMVVIGLYLNDARPPQGFIGENNSAVINFLKLPILRSSALSEFVQIGYYALVLGRESYENPNARRFAWTGPWNDRKWRVAPQAYKELIDEARYDWGAAWVPAEQEKVLQAIYEIHEQYRAKGIKLAVIQFPANVQVYAEFNDEIVARPQRGISKALRLKGIPELDLLPIFRENRQGIIFADQCHLTADGNRIAMKAIEPFVKGLLSL
ncbi:MAG: hypothetical protein HS115_18375 [Spirochaetales bacterium]|nr:hypothetical protein [Spirochaetales bacterium]